MKKIIMSLMLLLLSTSVFCQTGNGTIFKYNAVSEMAVLANVILFQIIISEENPDPEQAYQIVRFPL